MRQLISVLMFFAPTLCFAQESLHPPAQRLSTIVVVPTEGVLGRVPDEALELEKGDSAAKVTLDEVLNESKGLFVARQGGPGQQTSLFVRGSSSSHVLLLVDGVEVNDVSDVAGAADLSRIEVQQIERVDIYYGAASLRFGSGAVGAVVNLITRRGSGPLTPFASIGGGSYETWQTTAGFAGGTQKWDYSLSLRRFESEGISAAAGYHEKDGHKFTAGSWRLGYSLSERTRLSWISRANMARTELDFATGPGYSVVADDPDYYNQSKHFLNALQLEHRAAGLHSSLTASHGYIDRQYRNEPDAGNSETFRDDRLGRTLRLDNANVWELSSAWRLTFGPSLRKEQTPSAETTLWGGFAEAAWVRGGFTANAGARLDNHSEFGNQPSHGLGAAYYFTSTQTTLRGRWSTGFKSPSLFQLFDPVYGNRNLRPEEARSLEGGLEQWLFDERLSLSLTYFDNAYRNMIGFGTSYVNVDAARAHGLDAGATYQWSKRSELFASYTYTESRDLSTGQSFLRRPWHLWGAGANLKLTDRIKAGLTWRGVGGRRDIDALTFTNTEMPTHDVVDLSGDYTLSQRLQLEAQIKNLFDRNYQQVSGYGTPGLSAYGGLRWQM